MEEAPNSKKFWYCECVVVSCDKHNTMIQPNELRIGNAVLYSGHYNKITGIIPPYPNKDKRWDGKWVIEINPPDVFNVTLDELSTISLTPEVLEKCGFEASNVGNHIMSKNGVIVFFEKGKWGIRCDSRCSLNYLHQLQNLYFALTGEELNYTP